MAVTPRMRLFMPEAPSVCPIWDLNEVITVRLAELKNAFRARTSSASPCRVLVAWHSTRSTASGP